MSNICAIAGNRAETTWPLQAPWGPSDSSFTGQKDTPGVVMVPAADLSPGAVRGRMLFARYFNTNSNSFQKLFSTKQATTEQTF